MDFTGILKDFDCTNRYQELTLLAIAFEILETNMEVYGIKSKEDLMNCRKNLYGDSWDSLEVKILELAVRNFWSDVSDAFAKSLNCDYNVYDKLRTCLSRELLKVD